MNVKNEQQWRLKPLITFFNSEQCAAPHMVHYLHVILQTDKEEDKHL